MDYDSAGLDAVGVLVPSNLELFFLFSFCSVVLTNSDQPALFARWTFTFGLFDNSTNSFASLMMYPK